MGTIAGVAGSHAAQAGQDRTLGLSLQISLPGKNFKGNFFDNPSFLC